MLPPSSGSSEKLVPYRKATRRHNPKDLFDLNVSASLLKASDADMSITQRDVHMHGTCLVPDLLSCFCHTETSTKLS